MNNLFPEIKKKLGFGCMRFPTNDGKIDRKSVCDMFDIFIENGFNYFDTARPYLNGESEVLIRECLANRYPRESFVLTNKLSSPCFKTEGEIRPLFEDQLKACGVDYFDFYLMHSQKASIYEKYKKLRAYETALELKKEGKFKHLGISFHDEAPLLDRILTEYPEIEVVQLQINYIDYDDSAIQGRRCMEVARKHGKPVIVMEPVKGGCLANLPSDAKEIFDELGNASPASYAIRFAAGFEDVVMVLSGMASAEQVRDNISYMKDFMPLDEKEENAVKRVTEVFRSKNMISCTACRYCVDGCPKKIQIPDLFACMNSKKIFNNWNSSFYYNSVLTGGEKGKASDCIECGACETICPQKLNIRELLKEVAAEFEKSE